MTRKEKRLNTFYITMLSSGIFIMTLVNLSTLAESIKHKSRSMQLARELEAKKRLHGEASSPAYVCYGAGVKEQLEKLLH